MIPPTLLADEKLSSTFLSIVDYPIPRSYCIDRKKVKAIILGADPSNFTNKGQPKKLDAVFGIGSDEPGYFDAPLKNMEAVGLSLDDVYVDNLVKNYCNAVTQKNKHWKQIAKEWIPILKAELDEIDPQRIIPVLLTAGVLREVLVEAKERKHSNMHYYTCQVDIPIKAEHNKLERPLIPFYRNTRPPNYLLTNPRWEAYVQQIKRILGTA